jgi:hypothetical protein
MKCNRLITAALLAVGLISQASASSTATIGGTTYTVVYITGSTAFRANVFTAVSTSLFDSTPTTQPASGVTGSTSAYNIYGTIGGSPYLLSFDFTGSEAGLASLQNVAVSNPNTDNSLVGYSGGAVNLPGTPQPTGFISPTGGSAVTAQPDLAFSDTSKAVSITAANVSLVDYGIVAVIPFTWAKGKDSSPDSSWTHLTNITDPQANLQLGGGQTASFLTGYPADGDDVYTIGRNKGSGTRVNTLLDTLHGVGNAVDQWVPANAQYVGGTPTFEGSTTTTLAADGGLSEVVNDGFDSGSGVAKTLALDVNGYNDGYTNVITIGYLGVSDFQGTAFPGGAVALTLNGVVENDATVQSGNYSFWGHEHLYGTVGQSTSSPGGFIARKLAGTTDNTQMGTAYVTAGSALETSFGTGGGREANPYTTTAAASTAIDPATVHADKTGDTGYPSQQN